jgi:hypothetical protein
MKEPVDDEITGLPGLRTWRQVYAAVMVTFVLWVALLTFLGRVYS